MIGSEGYRITPLRVLKRYVTPDVKGGESNVTIRHKSGRGDRIAVNSTGSNEIQRKRERISKEFFL